METTTRLILPEVIEALETSPQDLVELTEELHPADLADLASALSPEQAQKLLSVLPVEYGARLLEHLDEERRSQVFAAVAVQELDKAAALTDEMAADDRADLYATLGEELRSELLDAIDEEESRDIRQLLAYPEDSAGSLMTTEFVALPANVTAQQAIEIIRETAADKETIYQAYAVDKNGTLLGVFSLRDLVVSPATRTVGEIMNPNIVSVPVEDDQEEVARVIAKYDLLALPVVDRHHRIVGIITVDDAIDVVQEEATEDVHKMGAVEPLDQPYIMTPFWTLIRARAPWLVVLFVAVLATRNVLEHYSNVDLAAAAMLMWFVPLIAASGGNSGSQSATLVIRALALGRLELAQTWRVLVRELLVGVTLGAILGVVGMLSTLAWESTRFAGMVFTISLSVIGVVTVGALIGSGIPLLLQRLKIDPAVASTPFITSMVDIAGLVIFFEIARLFLD
ncbi:MAG TPA: magnesium transporter [Kofleriaceae bacterium]|nr:magnesium transporter [Kofleriaceae bacterium]